MSGCNAFGKSICSICYEDLKPIIEDLQVIFICGHVFHELCLQQWFEYCSKAKRRSCPVCKQTCCQKNVGRLYFQSIGDPDSILSQKSPGGGVDGDPETLRRQVRKLEGKLSGITSAFERQQKDLQELNEELCICKEKAKKEAQQKNEALKQKESINMLLSSKSEELVRSSLECSRLQDRNLALAKELTAFKLVSDLSLEEDEVLKLASFGNGANSKDTIDILKKSLVLRNKSYKELMAQCNLLGRGETRSLKKLEKAEEKIKKLKTRLREAETTLEMKDNEVLRALKASKKTNSNKVDINGSKCNSSSLHISKCSLEDQVEQPVVTLMNSDQTGGLNDNTFHSNKTNNSKFLKDMGVNTSKDNASTVHLDEERGSYILIDDDASEISTALHERSSFSGSGISRMKVASDIKKEPLEHGQSGSVDHLGSNTGIKNDVGGTDATTEEDVMLLDDITEIERFPPISKEGPCSVPISQPGDLSFSGGLLGPDGATRYLGKWCKRAQSKGSIGSSASPGDLIAVGADGRGGRVKVLRSQNQSLDTKGGPLWPKRCKYGNSSSSQQSRGCLQIEHFFGKAGP